MSPPSPLAGGGRRPGQATETSEVAALARSTVQTRALNSETANWLEAMRIMVFFPLSSGGSDHPIADATLVAGSVPVS